MSDPRLAGEAWFPMDGRRQPAPSEAGSRSYPARGSSLDPTEAERIRERREAIAELGDAVRLIVERSAGTEAPVEDLRVAAARIRVAAAGLGTRIRDRRRLPSADDLLGGIRIYNPVCGSGSGLAPPLRIDVVDGGVVGSCVLGLAFEGPPAYAHGGVSALLLDQLLGYAVSASGHPGMTVELANRYRAPVPLQTPLHLQARVVGVEGRAIRAHGWIAAASAPEESLVEATGVFLELTGEQVGQLFHGLTGSPVGTSSPSPGPAEPDSPTT